MMNIAFKQAHSGNYRRAARGKEDIWLSGDSLYSERRAIPRKITRITSLGRRFRPQRTILWTKTRSGSRSATRISHGTAHARTYFHPYCRNANSIGIELCSRKNGEKFYFMPETVRRAQALTCELMAKYGIPLENVVRHYDVTHKNCPAPFVESASAWTAFKQGLQKKEEPDMTEAEVKKIIESTRRTYNSVSAVPAWAKPTVEKLTRKGWLLGDEHGKLDLTEELLRTLVINDRAGIYGE